MSPIHSWKGRIAAMSNAPIILAKLGGWQITGIVVGLLVVFVLRHAKDIIRYIKISSM